ncbi:MAG: rhodanese-like domain-containing protein [Pseudomonadota bacterium]
MSTFTCEHVGLGHSLSLDKGADSGEEQRVTTAGEIGVVNPSEAYEALTTDPKTLLIDVRTRAEWSFVGVPDISVSGKQAALIEWQSFPTMAVNEAFASQALDAADQTGAATIFFICRSGARSMSAAVVTKAAAASRGAAMNCINVAEGFEGDLDAEGRRGIKNGWKARDLPWRQS